MTVNRSFTIIGLGLLLIFITKISYAQHFSNVWSGNPYQPMSIIVQSATINGIDMEAGDEIAVFDIGDNGANICVGSVVLTATITSDNPAIIIASQDETGGIIDGFTSGNTIVFKLWDASQSKEISMVVPTFNASFSSVYTPLGTAVVTFLEGVSETETTASSMTICPGSIIVPIDVANVIDVVDFSLVMDYETTNLSYDGYQNTNDQLVGGTLTVTEIDGEITISWNSSTPINISSASLLDLLFTASSVNNQITENLVWNTSSSYYINSSETSLETEFINGQIIINPIPYDAGVISGTNNVCQGLIGEQYQIGAITNATSYVWELIPSSAGTVSGSGTSINIDFSDTYSGQANISVYGSNSCGVGLESSLTIDIIPNPTANAGGDADICSDATYTLLGTASNYSDILWTSTGDGDFDNNSILTATYFPGASDLSNGSVELTLTASAIMPCSSPAVDMMTLTLLPAPTANAGNDASICGYEIYNLSGEASNYQSALWTTSGDGVFDNPESLSTNYIPSQNDINSGSVIITLNAIAIPPCSSAASDEMTLTLNEVPMVNAGVNDTIPLGLSTILNGSGDGGEFPYEYLWSPSTALSDVNVPNPVATPETSITYNLTITDNNACSNSDSVEIVVFEYYETIWIENPYEPMTLILNSATLDGIELNIGDEIAVFDIDESDNEICVGYGIVRKSITPEDPLLIVVSSDNPATSFIDGFTPGNTIIFKCWLANTEIEYSNYEVTYNPLFDSFFTPLGTALLDVNFIDQITQILDLNKNILEIKVYPNPLNHQLNIELKSDEDIQNEIITLKIFDLQGILIIERELQVNQNITSLNIANLPSGEYILILINNKIQYSQKIIKK